MRVLIELQAPNTAAIRAAAWPLVKLLADGFNTIITPNKPNNIATHLISLIRSPSIGIDSSVINIGIANNIAYTCANGSTPNA